MGPDFLCHIWLGVTRSAEFALQVGQADFWEELLEEKIEHGKPDVAVEALVLQRVHGLTHHVMEILPTQQHPQHAWKEQGGFFFLIITN